MCVYVCVCACCTCAQVVLNKEKKYMEGMQKKLAEVMPELQVEVHTSFPLIPGGRLIDRGRGGRGHTSSLLLPMPMNLEPLDGGGGVGQGGT